MKSKIFSALPILGAIALGLVLSQLTIDDRTAATGQIRVVEEVSAIAPEVTGPIPDYQPVPKEEGAGFQPPVTQDGQCVCPCDGKCLTEDQVRKIVRDEFDNQVRAEAVAPRASIPGAVGYSSPVVSSTVVSSSPVVYSSGTVCSDGSCATYASPAPYYSQPTTTVVRQGVFGRRVYQTSSSGTCRVVNGRMVCN